MRLYHSLKEIDFIIEASVVTVGMFDGLHLGHKSVIQNLVEISKKVHIPSIVLTFSNHPQTYFRPDAANYVLSSISEKVWRLKQLGVEIVIVLPFDDYIASLSAFDFAANILFSKLKAKYIVFGYDNHFGHNREGSKSFIDAEFPHIQTQRISESMINGEVVSSSLIKNKIQEGYVKQAAILLGYQYSISGCVIKGDQLGRTIGFPTANLDKGISDKIIPSHGVYLTKSKILGKEYFGMTNIGFRPTVTNKQELRIETNLFDFDMEIYGEDIHVEFIDRLRDEKKFDSFPALVNQLNLDRINAKKMLAQIHITT